MRLVNDGKATARPVILVDDEKTQTVEPQIVMFSTGSFHSRPFAGMTRIRF